MSIIRIPTGYYRQHDADLTREVPAEGFGGWAKENLEFDLDRSAIVVMHAVDCGTAEQSPGRYRSVEYLSRSNEIATVVFPKLLGAVRDAGLRVFHLPIAGDYYQHLPGYLSTLALTEVSDRKPRMDAYSSSESSVLSRLLCFKRDNVFPGRHNTEANLVSPKFNFYPQAVPLSHESIAEDEDQLFAICRHYRIEHLVYIGFAIDGCLLSSSGGMVDMTRRGIVCSVIREAVTAIETKETARTETAKEIALWRVAVLYGFVYELEDFMQAIRAIRQGD